MLDPSRTCLRCMSPLPSEGAVCSVCGTDNAEVRNQQHQLPAGSILAGSYFVGCALGQGGFGVTYVGWDLVFDQKVAVKEYYPDGCVTREQSTHSIVVPMIGDKGEFFTRGKQKFVDEARILARFSDDPCIVNVRRFFQENGTSYIVMDFIEGKTLKAYAKERGGKLPANEALTLLRPLMASLSRVHEAGLLHRDIAPDNIMLQPDGSVKLLDFGAARQISAMGEKSLTINVKHGFAPEEQYRSRGEQGPWTDIYALCATIYALTTGKLPPQAMDRLADDTPVPLPNSLGANFAPAEQAALMKGLSVRGKNRQQSMAELMDELDGTIAVPLPAPEPPKKKKTKRKKLVPILAAAAATIALAAVALFVFVLPAGTEQEMLAWASPVPDAEMRATAGPANSEAPWASPVPDAEMRATAGPANSEAPQITDAPAAQEVDASDHMRECGDQVITWVEGLPVTDFSCSVTGNELSVAFMLDTEALGETVNEIGLMLIAQFSLSLPDPGVADQAALMWKNDKLLNQIGASYGQVQCGGGLTGYQSGASNYVLFAGIDEAYEVVGYVIFRIEDREITQQADAGYFLTLDGDGPAEPLTYAIHGYTATALWQDGRMTVSLECPGLAEAYTVNKEVEGTWDCSWAVNFTVNGVIYFVATMHVSTGKEQETMLLSDMGSILLKEWPDEPDSFSTVMDVELSIEDDTLTWTFAPPDPDAWSAAWESGGIVITDAYSYS